jgi:hypothetical protein
MNHHLWSWNSFWGETEGILWERWYKFLGPKKNSNIKFIKTYNSLGMQNFFSILARQVKDHSKLSWLSWSNSIGKILCFQDCGSSPVTKQKRGSTLLLSSISPRNYTYPKKESSGTRRPKQTGLSKMLINNEYWWKKFFILSNNWYTKAHQLKLMVVPSSFCCCFLWVIARRSSFL